MSYKFQKLEVGQRLNAKTKCPGCRRGKLTQGQSEEDFCPVLREKCMQFVKEGCATPESSTAEVGGNRIHACCQTEGLLLKSQMCLLYPVCYGFSRSWHAFKLAVPGMVLDRLPAGGGSIITSLKGEPLDLSLDSSERTEDDGTCEKGFWPQTSFIACSAKSWEVQQGLAEIRTMYGQVECTQVDQTVGFNM